MFFGVFRHFSVTGSDFAAVMYVGNVWCSKRSKITKNPRDENYSEKVHKNLSNDVGFIEKAFLNSENE